MIRNEKKKHGYICPSCNEEQEYVIEWVNKSIGYEHNLETGDCERLDYESDGDFQNWSCPNCGADVSEDDCDMEDNFGLW